jgi:Ribosomal protein S18
MGKILPASRTGCTAKTQRKLSKAIRRARALGFMPIWSRHPTMKQNWDLQIMEDTTKEQMFRGQNATDFLARAQPSLQQEPQ